MSYRYRAIFLLYPRAYYSSRPVSACKEGTILKGLNVYSGKQDPVALPDDQYPDWLWDILTPAKKEFTASEMFSPQYLRYLSKNKIKQNAMKKDF